ncbi:MAG TPA: DUF998 domain-containing protein [Solirubrobacterales bacterium]|jgi:hypothetical protein|nr:DUF998 domain-containing protein [Solirubrobacterales bacterium]
MRKEPRSRLPVIATGIAAALLCNFWVLEGLLAKRNDLSGAWISDLAARSQVYGWRFQLLEVAAGLAIAALAVLLRRQSGDGSPLLRRGLLALLVAGLLAAIGGAAPLNCAEALERACDLSYDPFDLVHTGANLLEAVALAVAFALIGADLLGLDSVRRLSPRGIQATNAPGVALGRATLAIGALWLLLMAASGLAYLVGDLESAKGLFQRGAQLLLGAWLALLAICSPSP